jgi:hypothetical protein
VGVEDSLGKRSPDTEEALVPVEPTDDVQGYRWMGGEEAEDRLEVISSWSSSPDHSALVTTPHLNSRNLHHEWPSPTLSTGNSYWSTAPSSPEGYNPLDAFINLAFYPEPSPRTSLLIFNLSSLSASPKDRLALDCFEAQGYDSIIAASSNNTNWLFTHLFPYVVTMFNSIPTPHSENPVRDYMQHNLLRLAFVCKSNMEETRMELKEEYAQDARNHHHKASLAALKAKLAGNWKTETFL